VGRHLDVDDEVGGGGDASVVRGRFVFGAVRAECHA
jgi:hypothetical protein